MKTFIPIACFSWISWAQCPAGALHVTFPDVDPVWEFCVLRPSDSSGPSGSGVEIRDAYYRGILVFKRAHAPILNVDYDPGGCGCFRDWSNSERSFAMDNPLATPGFYEPTSNAETVCDNANSLTTPPGDCPWKVGQECHTGVAIEKSAERILITSQMQAGWYRYTMRWEFYVDGTIRPTFGFGVYNTSCSSASHRHHNYWRFDFDIDDAGNDFVQEVEGGVPNVFANEVTRTWTGASTAWEVYDASSGRGYRITPGSGDLDLPADAFSKLDFMASLYKAGELSDSGGGCAINEGTIANGESITNTDVVLWYRAGVHDVVGSNIFKCKAGGPILEPIGDWNMCGPDPGNLYPKWHSADIDYDYNTNGVVDVADYASLVNNDCIGP